MPTNVSARSSLRKLGILLFGLTFAAAVVVSTLWSSPPAQAGTAMASAAADDDDGPALPSDVDECTRHPERFSPAQLDRIYTLEHNVRVGPIGSHRRIHMTESFTLRSWLRVGHRAMLMLPGPPTKGDMFNVEIDGYRGREIIAHHDYFAFSVDYEGVGGSTYPVSGLEVTDERTIADLRQVINYVRRIRLVPKVDLLGGATGGGYAAELGSDDVRVRSVIMMAMIYKTGSDLFNTVFANPEFEAFLHSLPDGYLQTAPENYFNIVAASPPDVADWIRTTQPGRYSVAPLFGAFHLPWFDPTHARVPGIVIQGEFDQNAPQSDSIQLAAEYGSADTGGGAATCTFIAGALQLPYLEAPPHNTQFWDAVLTFVDSIQDSRPPRR